MRLVYTKMKPRDFLLALLFSQFIVYLTMLVDVPVARQVIVFVYLTFVPGLIIVKLLKLDELERLEIVLFSIGISVAFLMFAGLLINTLFPLFGVSEPLSLMPLMITLNSFILFGGVLVYLRSKDVKLLESTRTAENTRASPLALLFMGLPILSVVGAFWVNAYDHNLILIFLMIAICLLFVMGVISKKFLHPKLYPLAVLLIAVSILFHTSLISNRLIPFASDNPLEYYVFRVTESNMQWSSGIYQWGTLYGRVNSMLSVTVLPTIYSSMLNMDATWVLKILYPLIFSLVPLCLYQLWQKNFGTKTAFIATFLFMAQNTFYTEMLGLNRQIIAELFFVLLLLVVLSKKIKPLNRVICFTIFSFALVTSHYAIAEIFMLFISLVWIYLLVMKRPSRRITATMVMLFFVVMFSWYLYTANAAVFDSFVEFGNNVYYQLGDLFNLASREPEILRGLGLESSPTIWNTMSRVFAYLTEFFIVVGFVALITKRKNVKLKREYFVFTVMAFVILGALIAVPGLSGTMNITRFYHILLFFLAPLCVLGAGSLVKLLSRRQTQLGAFLLLIVLVPYFLFQTGFVYELAGTQSWSLPLSKHRMDTVFLRSKVGYFDECEVFGALWMSKNVAVGNTRISSSGFSKYFVLTSYGMVFRNQMDVLSNVTVLSIGEYVYLDRANIVDGFVSDSLNITSVSHVFGSASKIYSSGRCEIYAR
jgi:uncharacterized membrane protein